MELRQLVRDLYGIDQPQGCTEEEIAAIREKFGAIPPVLEDFWRTFGHTKELNYGQDDWIFPGDFQRSKYMFQFDDLRLFCENQACCWAGILRKDLTLPDPPVYTQEDEEAPWLLSAPTLSEFLEAALLYEAVWQLDRVPKEIYWLTSGELANIESKLIQYPVVLKNWMWMDITCYHNRPDNLVAVMKMESGDYQTLYGGATEESYTALLEVMAGLGEPI